jgi:hypothetical protein
MLHWLHFFLICAACVSVFFGPFWLLKIYYIVRSRNWQVVIGIMTEIRRIDGSEEGPVLTVSYMYDQASFVRVVMDSGSLNLEDKSHIGRRVQLLIDPKNPEKCVVKNHGDDLFNRTALYFANLIIRRISSPA